jgi:hypothetical protein
VRARLVLLLAFLWGTVRPAAAQLDYRNLDDDRPTFIEDAYPVERFAFELLAPWRYERAGPGQSLHLFVPELAWGVLPNAQIGLKAPVAGVRDGDGTSWGLAGVRAFALYNFFTEGMTYPAISLRTDLALPAGSLGGDVTRFGLKAIATRSFGPHRVHFNLAGSVGGDGEGPAGEPLARWSAGAAVDRTFIRESLLLVAEAYAIEHHPDEPTEILASIGARMQLRPTLVIDAGVGRRLTRNGPDFAITLGLSHAFGVTWLMPRPARGAGR